MQESSTSHAILENLMGKGYVSVYSENTGKIFGYDIASKNLPNGAKIQTIIRAHMVSIDVYHAAGQTIHHANFENIATDPAFIAPISSYFDIIETIYSKVS